MSQTEPTLLTYGNVAPFWNAFPVFRVRDLCIGSKSGWKMQVSSWNGDQSTITPERVAHTILTHYCYNRNAEYVDLVLRCGCVPCKDIEGVLTLPFTLFPLQQSKEQSVDSTKAHECYSKKSCSQGQVQVPSMAEHPLCARCSHTLRTTVTYSHNADILMRSGMNIRTLWARPGLCEASSARP